MGDPQSLLGDYYASEIFSDVEMPGDEAVYKTTFLIRHGDGTTDIDPGFTVNILGESFEFYTEEISEPYTKYRHAVVERGADGEKRCFANQSMGNSQTIRKIEVLVTIHHYEDHKFVTFDCDWWAHSPSITGSATIEFPSLSTDHDTYPTLSVTPGDDAGTIPVWVSGGTITLQNESGSCISEREPADSGDCCRNPTVTACDEYALEFITETGSFAVPLSGSPGFDFKGGRDFGTCDFPESIESSALVCSTVDGTPTRRIRILRNVRYQYNHPSTPPACEEEPTPVTQVTITRVMIYITVYQPFVGGETAIYSAVAAYGYDGSIDCTGDTIELSLIDASIHDGGYDASEGNDLSEAAGGEYTWTNVPSTISVDMS